MKWHFSTNLYHIEIGTPWFWFAISNGDKDLNKHGYWWGFEFYWKPNWYPTNMGSDFGYGKCIRKVSCFIPYRNLI